METSLPEISPISLMPTSTLSGGWGSRILLIIIGIFVIIIGGIITYVSIQLSKQNSNKSEQNKYLIEDLNKNIDTEIEYLNTKKTKLNSIELSEKDEDFTDEKKSIINSTNLTIENLTILKEQISNGHQEIKNYFKSFDNIINDINDKIKEFEEKIERKNSIDGINNNIIKFKGFLNRTNIKLNKIRKTVKDQTKHSELVNKIKDLISKYNDLFKAEFIFSELSSDIVDEYKKKFEEIRDSYNPGDIVKELTSLENNVNKESFNNYSNIITSYNTNDFYSKY